MKFKVGDKVKVVDNSDMVVSLGATAVVVWVYTGMCKGNELIGVEWKTQSNCQMDGLYRLYHFQPVAIEKGEQFLFSFMSE